MPEGYNYEHFVLNDEEMADFENFKRHLNVGEPAPDGDLVDAHSGETVRLSALWKRNHVVMEFGSFT